MPVPKNETVLEFAPGSPERETLLAEIERQSKDAVEIPLVIGGERVTVGEPVSLTAPHNHSLRIGVRYDAGPEQVERAIAAALAAKTEWSRRDQNERASIFRRAADLLSGPWRFKVLAATMLNQSKTPHQAEIDATAELCDFFRFNAHFAETLVTEPLISPEGVRNRWDLRPLDGFVLAVTPFNFTSIAGNLPTAPALLGNTVVWKPSPLAALSGHFISELLKEAGLPDGVINVVQGDAEKIVSRALAHPEFAGLHFTGSTRVLRGMYRSIGQNIERYRSYPRIVGESGGKDFVVAHSSADPTALAVGLVRGAFEFQGQKCSAVSRAYLPRSLWPKLRAELSQMISGIKVGDPANFHNFMGAVIGRSAYDRIVDAERLALGDPACAIIAGGGASDSEGYFIEPTLIETKDAQHELMQREVFGPLLTVWIYDDDRFEEVLDLCDSTSGYALTGAIFARSPEAVSRARERLRFSAGNFYVNDKPTGAVVGQQPFGGARLSGTNDKAGSAWNLARWVSPRVIKENFAPPTDFRYPYMK